MVEGWRLMVEDQLYDFTGITHARCVMCKAPTGPPPLNPPPQPPPASPWLPPFSEVSLVRVRVLLRIILDALRAGRFKQGSGVKGGSIVRPNCGRRSERGRV